MGKLAVDICFRQLAQIIRRGGRGKEIDDPLAFTPRERDILNPAVFLVRCRSLQGAGQCYRLIAGAGQAACSKSAGPRSE